ncbi:MAG: type II toxin-antitoxin system PemK/MazF family toxin [Chloroflexi bacterium]|nr:type II toxin-antitoxin system PemK/MazF family toxin [Chloroflexota bacterium]
MVKRGEVYWVNWNPARGSEQAGIRPSLVIQNDVGNRYSPTTIVAAMTTAAERPYPFTVDIPATESGLPRDGTVNLSAIMTVDKGRLVNHCGTLSAERMRQVDAALMRSLGLR